ncbi:MAG TPA: hypothetical protein VJ938_00250, partial [Acidimicrobiia bacterium]|nr:hypothetical protein [Acidimicrobiia bacterium]
SALAVDNIALAPILMDWTWNPASGRDPDAWWDSQIYDFMGVDHYVCYNDESSCQDDGMLTGDWATIRAWAATEGVDLAVGEWGMRGTDADAGERVRSWFEHAVNSHQDGGGARVVGMAAFDSDPHNTESFELAGEQLAAFHELMGDNRAAEPEPWSPSS